MVGVDIVVGVIFVAVLVLKHHPGNLEFGILEYHQLIMKHVCLIYAHLLRRNPMEADGSTLGFIDK